MESIDIFRELEFNQEWIDLGIITAAKLRQFEAEWATGEDKNTEHYRWRAFLDFIEPIKSLDENSARALYNLGANEPDGAVGGSIMANVLRRKDCPKDLLELAAKSEEKHLRKIANERLAADIES